MNWNDYFFSLVQTVKTKSKDPGTQFGCVIVGPDNELRSTGYNSFPRGLNDNVEERFNRPEKYVWFEHAERNAIYNAARMGTPLKGCRLYVDAIPCVDCTRGIIQAGIIKVMYDDKHWQEYIQKYSRRVKEQLAKGEKVDDTWFSLIEKSLQMFNECGVEIETYKRGQ